MLLKRKLKASCIAKPLVCEISLDVDKSHTKNSPIIMSKKILSKATKAKRIAKDRAWKERVYPFLKDHEPYRKRVVLLGNTYLSEYEDGTVEVYASIGPRPSLDYGVSYHVVLCGAHGTPIIHKWVYAPKDRPLEDIWKEACNTVDEIASQEIVDKEYLIVRGFEWD